MYKYVKRFFDIIFSLLFIVIFSPLLLLTYIALKLSLGGKIWQINIRYGLHKVPFKMYKFKTLNGDRSMQREKRLTKTSKFIRLIGFDELPQLFNILLGNMSFIGPRPFLVKDKDELPKNAHNPKRYKVKPGVLGYAQAKGRRNITHDEKIKWDLKYVDEISLWTDFKLFWMTIFTMLNQEKNELISLKKINYRKE